MSRSNHRARAIAVDTIMSLAKYNLKRDFRKTSEPSGHRKKSRRASGSLSFVVQEHHARHLHYDFRLEWQGVLKSWAVPKGPSMDPQIKRLAVEVEDHPISYGSFEGVIPERQYGAGEVFIWDKGTWQPTIDPALGFKKGHLSFELKGRKLRGHWDLIRTKIPGRTNQWLLIKKEDHYSAELPPEEPPRKSTIAPNKLTSSKKHPFIPPELALLVEEPPEGKSWIHELKYDGYRLQAHIYGDDVHLFTRSGQDWTKKFSQIADSLKKLKIDSAIIDGEVVLLDETGRSDFQLLQNALKAERTSSMFYYAFDLLYLSGKDLRQLSLKERKAKLKSILKKSASRVRYSAEFKGTGKALLQLARQHHLEGIICKNVNSTYRSERNSNWVKVKCTKQQEFVIGGYTEGTGGRSHFGALLLGVYKNNKLQYVGKVGTGFTQQSLSDVMKALHPLEQKESPFDKKSPRERGIHWVKPRLSAEITFANWTDDEILRVPVFHGLREDKAIREIKKETSKKSVRDESWSITNPDKILFAKEKVSKREVAHYYSAVADKMIPLMADRPLSLVRCPQGTSGKCFFQKHPSTIPSSMTPIRIRESGGTETYVSIHDRQGLAELVQMNAFEIHCNNSRADHVERPDQIVMDLDPGPGVSWKTVIESALELKKTLEKLKLKSFVKLSGGKGLHVHIPINPIYTWDEVNSFSHALALQMEQRDPDLYVSKMTKTLREGRIFIDYLRNSRGATAVAPYSLRAHSLSSVALPLTWAQLKRTKGSDIFPLKKALAFLKKQHQDPWEGYTALHQNISLLDKQESRSNRVRSSAEAKSP